MVGVWFVAVVVFQQGAHPGSRVSRLERGPDSKGVLPRIVLPLSLANATFFTWMLEMAVLVVALSLLGSFVLPWLPLVAVFMVVFGLFSVGLAMVLSVINVYFRDLSYLLPIVLQFWFYLTPILYPVELVETQSEKLGGLVGTPITLLDLYTFNPVEGFVEIFRNLLYDNRAPELSTVLIALGWTVLAFECRSLDVCAEREDVGGASMSDWAVRVSDVSKRFRLYHERNQTFKSAILRGKTSKHEDFWALKGHFF